MLPDTTIGVMTLASETSVNFYQATQRKNPEDIHLPICRRENLKTLDK
jgi:hypothetical protein